MTKILYIHDFDESYAAMEIESNIGINELANLVEENGGILDYENEEYNFACIARILYFDNVDEKFITFIKNNFIDYDQSKHSNFYLLEDK